MSREISGVRGPTQVVRTMWLGNLERIAPLLSHLTQAHDHALGLSDLEGFGRQSIILCVGSESINQAAPQSAPGVFSLCANNINRDDNYYYGRERQRRSTLSLATALLLMLCCLPLML